jgi:hypothetical protein
VMPGGAGLVYAGYLGGSAGDYGSAIAVDASGAAYVVGGTGSANFPVVVGPDLAYNGGYDAFVAKILPGGAGLAYAGFIGGGASDEVYYGLAVDAAGAAYVTGKTTSTDFPVVGGPDLTYNGGASDAFVVKVLADGSGLAYAGYLGGSAADFGYSIAVDTAGAVYVTGKTSSTDFPALGGPDLTYNGGTIDVFVANIAAFNPAPTGLSVYLPLVLRNAAIYYEGPWETEPNNTYLQANGPIRSGRDYYGYPNDDRDYWSFFASTPGNIQVDLTNHTGQGVQLQLFYQSPAGGPVAIATSPPYHLDYNGPAGWYYVYIYTAGGYNQSTPYTLRVSYL